MGVCGRGGRSGQGGRSKLNRGSSGQQMLGL